VAISILWIPIIRAAQGSRLFDYIQAVQSFLAPPVAACYLLGVLWKRINEEVKNFFYIKNNQILKFREHFGVLYLVYLLVWFVLYGNIPIQQCLVNLNIWINVQQ